MYRQQYPDAPNLFTRYRRSIRRPLLQEFQRNWLISIIGIAMVCTGIGVILWNEGKAVQTSRALEQGHRDLVIPETTAVVFEENNGKLVFVADRLKVPTALHDQDYKISINAVKLKRVVQMYQWYEIEDRRETPSGVSDAEHDGHVETSYSYDVGWFDKRMNSEAFNNELGHHNPEYWPVNSTEITNDWVKIGDFVLSTELKAKFTDYSVFTSDERPSDPNIKMHAGLYYHSNDVWRPQVGDIRIQFSYAGKDGELVTVIGKQSGREIRPYKTESGEELLLLHPGLKTASEVFNHEHNQNRMRTYILRFGGWFACFLGFSCVSTLLDLLVIEYPAVQNALGLGFASLPFSFASSATVFAVGVGWLVYRPLLSVLLFLIASVPCAFATLRYYQISRTGRRQRLS